MNLNFLNFFIDSHFSERVFNKETDFLNCGQEISDCFDEFMSKVRPCPSAVSSWKCFSYSEGDYEYVFVIKNNNGKLEFHLLLKKVRIPFPSLFLPLEKLERLDRPMTEDEIREYGIPALVQCGASWLTCFHDDALIKEEFRRLLCHSSNLKVVRWLSTFSGLASDELAMLVWTASRLFVIWENEFEKSLNEEIWCSSHELEQLNSWHSAWNRWSDQEERKEMCVYGFPLSEPFQVLASLVKREDITIDMLRFVFRKLESIETKDKNRFPAMLAEEVRDIPMLLDLILEGNAPESVRSVVDKRFFA